MSKKHKVIFQPSGRRGEIEDLRGDGYDVHPVRVDVSSASDVTMLAETAASISIAPARKLFWSVVRRDGRLEPVTDFATGGTITVGQTTRTSLWRTSTGTTGLVINEVDYDQVTGKWRLQLGTLGSGNHFIEVTADEEQRRQPERDLREPRQRGGFQL